MISIQVMVSEEFWGKTYPTWRLNWGEEWRSIVCKTLTVAPEEVEVLWLPFRDAINALPITLDVEFRPISTFFLHGIGINVLRDALLHELAHQMKGVITQEEVGVWIRPFSDGLFGSEKIE